MDFRNVTPDDIIFGGRKLKPPQTAMGIVLAVCALLVLFALPTVFYSIEPNEVGVVRRFGRFDRVTDPGLHLKLPYGLEQLDRVKIEYVYKEEFGFRTKLAGVSTQYSQENFDDESLMLTGDLNVLDVEWIVQFRIKDPVAFLFNVRDQKSTIRDAAESVMRAIVGDYSFNEALTEKRIEISDKAQQMMQQILDSYDSGIGIVTVKLQDVNPPKPVQPAFNAVNAARQEKEQMINQAWQVYNQKIPAARGQALKIISQAEGYAQETVNRAKGDADRFTQLMSAYENARDVTRRRIYLEKMQEILKRSGRVYVVDSQVKGLLPLLNLDKQAASGGER